MRTNNSTIAMGANGLPLFWKTWPALYREAWMLGLKKRVWARLGCNLEELMAEVVAKIKADQRAKKPTQRELYAQWDREAKLASALNAASRRLVTKKAPTLNEEPLTPSEQRDLDRELKRWGLK